MNTNDIGQLEKQLTQKLETMRTEALERYKLCISKDGLQRNPSVQSFHALIGGKNNTFVDSIRTRFSDPNDFIAKWLKGLNDQYAGKKYRKADGTEYGYILIEMLKDTFIREYTFTFLERNFYRNLIERKRAKPDDEMWELWIGNGGFVLGILITPVFRNGAWKNDVSEIRRADYNYWTVKHIMRTGFIDPDEVNPIIFSRYEELFVFYKSILKKLSSSEYEKAIFDKYIEYLMQSENIDEEPLLIPEIRYAGQSNSHKYRLDFTVLNAHTMEYIGFELSPSSSHMSVSGINSGKTQTKMNEELSIKWGKEMAKRNEYFSKYEITTVTFADTDLSDIDAVFSVIKSYLEKRIEGNTSISNEIERILKS